MDVRGTLVRDVARAPLGRVQDVLFDPDTQDARWLSVVLDSDGSTVLVPAAATSEFAVGELLVPYSAEVVSEATHPHGRALGAVEAERLLRLYGFDA